MKKHKNGFTLSEVLITLVIIGIVAAMTIPTVINKSDDKALVVATKKAYSVLNHAYQGFLAENLPLTDESTAGSKERTEFFVEQLNVQKVCGWNSKNGECFSTENGGQYYTLSGRKWTNLNSVSSVILGSSKRVHYKIMLANGMAMAVSTISAKGDDDGIFGDVFVDVNGNKGPNTLGKDTFFFYFTKDEVVPAGMPGSKYALGGDDTFGRGCAAWVITKGNMDYLRKDVSW